MSEIKNRKRNKTRKGVNERPFYSGIQSNYNRKPVNNKQMKLI